MEKEDRGEGNVSMYSRPRNQTAPRQACVRGEVKRPGGALGVATTRPVAGTDTGTILTKDQTGDKPPPSASNSAAPSRLLNSHNTHEKEKSPRKLQRRAITLPTSRIEASAQTCCKTQTLVKGNTKVHQRRKPGPCAGIVDSEKPAFRTGAGGTRAWATSAREGFGSSTRKSDALAVI